jgi:ATP-binding cassette subfamily C exporter for protease/lipase
LRAFGFSVIASVLAMAPSVYMLAVYDRVLNSRSHLTLWMLTGLVLFVYAVMEALDWARARLMQQAEAAWHAQLRRPTFDAVFAVHLRRQAAASHQPLSDLGTLGDFIISPVLTAAMETPAALVFMAAVFAIHPMLGWAALTAATVQTAVALLNQRGTQPLLQQAMRQAIEARRYAQGALRSAQAVRAMGMAPSLRQRWRAAQGPGLAQQAEAAVANGAYQALARLLQNVTGSMLLGLGAWLVLRDELAGGAGMMIVASVLGGRALAPLVQLIAQWRAVVGVLDAWGRLSQFLAGAPPRAPTMALPAPSGELAVQNLSATVTGSPTPILKGLSFALRAGEVLAVVGPTGAGKSTLARVLMGAWPAAGGTVRLCGADLAAWDKSELGPYLGYLPQGVELFEGTLAENIARFGEADPARVQAAARAVGLHDAITALPQGYDTPVGPEGALLSGGQRQRVGLARALYGAPVFVVLDEPNASLDPQGEAALLAAIAQLKTQGTTFVVMTHRSGVLAVADQILVLVDGQAAALGPRDEVLAKLYSNANAPKRPAVVGRPAAVAVTATGRG